MSKKTRVNCKDPKEIFVLAESFEYSSLCAANAKFTKDFPEIGLYTVKLGISAIVNGTFATELFLKFISCVENETFFWWGHDLNLLFSYLSEEHQKKIIEYHDYYCSKDPLRNEGFARAFGDDLWDFHAMLNQSALAYTDFRYNFDTAKLKPYNLNRVSRAIRQLAIDLRPDYKVLFNVRDSKPT